MNQQHYGVNAPHERPDEDAPVTLLAALVLGFLVLVTGIVLGVSWLITLIAQAQR